MEEYLTKVRKEVCVNRVAAAYVDKWIAYAETCYAKKVPVQVHVLGILRAFNQQDHPWVLYYDTLAPPEYIELIEFLTSVGLKAFGYRSQAVAYATTTQAWMKLSRNVLEETQAIRHSMIIYRESIPDWLCILNLRLIVKW
jgi:hypothetical protein